MNTEKFVEDLVALLENYFEKQSDRMDEETPTYVFLDDVAPDTATISVDGPLGHFTISIELAQ